MADQNLNIESQAEDGAVEAPKKELTKGQERQLAHKQVTEERASRMKHLKGLYLKLKDDEAFQDLLAKVSGFREYHKQIATDGVGQKEVGKDQFNKPIFDTVSLTPEQRVSHLDRAAGIEEITNYIERMIDLPKE